MTSRSWFGWPIAAFCLILSSTTVSAASSITMQVAAPECPTPRVPYGISFACAQAASAEALNNVAPGAVDDPPRAAESAAPDCPTPRSQWEWFACAHAPHDTEVGPALVPSISCADGGICVTAEGDQ